MLETVGWMDGWTDGCMDGWTDGWMDGWASRSPNAAFVGFKEVSKWFQTLVWGPCRSLDLGDD